MIQTIEEFYNDTLKSAGVTRKPSDLAKIASEKGVGVEIVKLAKAYYEQLQLDDVPYESEKLRAVDAMKLASSYFEHVDKEQKTANDTADNLLRYLTHAAEGYCAHNNLSITGRDAVKIAGLQAESAEEAEKQVQKVAGFQTPTAEAVEAATKFATTFIPATSQYTPSNFWEGIHGAKDANDGLFKIQDTLNRSGVSSLLPDNPNAAHATDFLNTYHQHQQSLPGGTSPLEIFKRMGGQSQSGSWASKHVGGLAAGALGLGALYMMHKKNKAEEQDRQDRQMSALRAAALPPA